MGGTNTPKSTVTDAHRKWVEGMGVKSASVSKSQGKGGPKTTTLTFEEEVIEVPVATGLPGDSGGEQMIKDQLTLFQTYIGDYWSNYGDGIQKFTNRMNFSSEEEAEPKYLDAVFTAVCKKALDIALDKVGKKMGGPWGEIIGLVKAAAEAYVTETERAAKAAGEVKIVQFINGLIDGISKGREGMRAAVEKGKRPMIEEYQKLAKADNLKGKVTPDGRIIGEAARIVQAVQKDVEEFKKALPAAAYFQQQFTRAFADTPGRTDLVSHGGREAGKLYFQLHLYLEVKDGKRNWSVDEDGTSPAWKLVTLSPNPERVAASLLESLGGGAKPWQIELGKKVMLRVEVEEFGPNAYHDGWVFFTDSPDQYEIGAFTNPKLAAEAWGLSIARSRVLNTAKLVGSNK
jgi:hypothetical protein